MIDLHFKELGEANRPALVILHGVFGSSDNWLTLGRQFAERFRVFLVDQRNHGRSPHHPEFSYEAMSGDLLRFIDAQGLERPHVIGHSMGGKVAMHFALNHPQRLDRLVVVDIAPRAYPVHHHRLIEAMQAIPLERLRSRGEAEDILVQYEPSAGVRQFLLKNLYRTPEGGFGWRINLPVIAAGMERISVEIGGTPRPGPALFIRGLQSHYVADADWPQIQRLFPQAQLLDFPEAGHWVHAEAPEAFYRAIMDFLP